MTEAQRQFALDMSVHALNWGGRYNHNRILNVFKYHTCYAPGHPDANPRGYVEMPITKLRDVVAKSRMEWLRISNLGNKSLDAIEITLASVGLRLETEGDGEAPIEEILRLQAEVIKRLDRIDMLTAELRDRYQQSLNKIEQA
jgi:hypothetical protein